MIRAISLGGGVQSTAMCVLAIKGEIQADLAIFANVGKHAENPETLGYLQWFIPWANEHGLETLERWWVDSHGHKRDLYDDVMDPERRSVALPVRFHWGGFGNRHCTDQYKIRVVGRELALRGATADDPAEVMIGISTDEFHRANKLYARKWEIPTFPLLELGYSRTDCEHIIADAGLPIPPKSACWFCPFQGPDNWARKKRDDPETFAKGVALERRINEIRVNIGRDEVYLGPPGTLLENLGDNVPAIPDEGRCDSGYCFT